MSLLLQKLCNGFLWLIEQNTKLLYHGIHSPVMILSWPICVFSLCFSVLLLSFCTPYCPSFYSLNALPLLLIQDIDKHDLEPQPRTFFSLLKKKQVFNKYLLRGNLVVISLGCKGLREAPNKHTFSEQLFFLTLPHRQKIDQLLTLQQIQQQTP